MNNEFTIEKYLDILHLVKTKYKIVLYDQIPWDIKNFALLRHDCDFSLNRANKIAEIENRKKVKSTYFINIHCKYYNPFEIDQKAKIINILEMGHDLGIHFDCKAYNLNSEQDLVENLEKEIAIFKIKFGITPKVFSFHNPTENNIDFNKEYYAGLINCYSKKFKSETSYCSDSNGYWRYENIEQFIHQSSSDNKNIQILTHPEWWQDEKMFPRQRIFRCINGRAINSMNHYDDGLIEHNRENVKGNSKSLDFLSKNDFDLYTTLDWLWMNFKFDIVYMELFKLLNYFFVDLVQLQISSLYKIKYETLNDFVLNLKDSKNLLTLFNYLFKNKLPNQINTTNEKLNNIYKIAKILTLNKENGINSSLEENCIFICEVINTIHVWSVENINYNFFIDDKRKLIDLFCKNINDDSSDYKKMLKDLNIEND
jgi:hypothetical protein